MGRSKQIIGDRATLFDASFVEQFVGHTIAEVERELILKTLDHFGGNRTRASVALGISLRCMRDKIQQFRAQGVDIPEGQPGPFINRGKADASARRSQWQPGARRWLAIEPRSVIMGKANMAE